MPSDSTKTNVTSNLSEVAATNPTTGSNPVSSLSGPSQPATHSSCPNLASLPQAPYLKPSDPEWRNFPALLEKARNQGMLQTGICVVDIPPEVAGPSWKGMPTANGTPATRNIESQSWSIHPTDNGVYRLKAKTKPNRFDLMNLSSPPREPMGAEFAQQRLRRFESDIEKALTGGKTPSFPPYATNQEVDQIPQRNYWGLNPQSPISKLEGDALDRTIGKFAGVHTLMLYASGGDGAPFGMHVDDFKLLAVNYLVCGSPKIWVVIAPADADLLEELMLKLNRQEPLCDQSVGHSYSWISTKLLDEAGIRYSAVSVGPGQAAIIGPGVYHQGFNTGRNIAEAKNYADDTWSPNGCKPCHSTCGSTSTEFITNAAMKFGKPISADPPIAVAGPKLRK